MSLMRESSLRCFDATNVRTAWQRSFGAEHERLVAEPFPEARDKGSPADALNLVRVWIRSSPVVTLFSARSNAAFRVSPFGTFTQIQLGKKLSKIINPRSQKRA